MIPFRRRHILSVAAAAALLAGCNGDAAQKAAKAGPTEISIENFSFTPSTVTVAAGTTVTWINNDEEAHSIVNVGQPTRLFRSPGLDDGDKYSFVFDKPGTYDYICSIHPRMTGKIVVQ